MNLLEAAKKASEYGDKALIRRQGHLWEVPGARNYSFSDLISEDWEVRVPDYPSQVWICFNPRHEHAWVNEEKVEPRCTDATSYKREEL